MQQRFLKEILIITTIVYLVVSSSISLGKIEMNSTNIKPVSNGNTLYVGGSGPNNYTLIQVAIDDASNGDTVFVYNGTYNEKLDIYKRINLFGENTHNTIIDSDMVSAIDIFCAFVNIRGFTLSAFCGLRISYGIRIYSSFCNISFCKFIDIYETGIQILGFLGHNNIYRNIFQDFYFGFVFENPFSCVNIIKQNNFISTAPAGHYLSFRNNWMSNYYDNWNGIGPKIIGGVIKFYPLPIPWFNVDWTPSQEPYDI
jgi:hypothetical protein